ncbi:hypothetical protein ACLBSL_33545, partial [Klebsiella pneumoniae]|uniref:hypothetical protein n=1 Tax=Klebsiella pneumoniae TaxID=573 RepID=UPI003968554D
NLMTASSVLSSVFIRQRGGDIKCLHIINRITGVSANIDTQFNCDSFYSVIDLLLDHYRVLTSMEYWIYLYHPLLYD